MQTRHAGITLLATSWAILANACAGDGIADETSGPGVPLVFDDGKATSWHEGSSMFTELQDSQGAVVATAQWDVGTRSGAVTIPGADSSLAVAVAAEAELDERAASELTHRVWINESATEIPFECTIVWASCSCCYYLSCANCVWIDSMAGGYYYCSVVGSSQAYCRPNCACVEDEEGGY